LYLYLYFIYTIALINFASFVQLSSLFRTCLAFALAVLFALCGFMRIGTNIPEQIATINSNFNETVTATSLSLYTTLLLNRFTNQNMVSVLDFALLVLLIWFINRQSELIQRLSFKCDQKELMKNTYAKNLFSGNHYATRSTACPLSLPPLRVHAESDELHMTNESIAQ
jgi:hypothetical protein